MMHHHRKRPLLLALLCLVTGSGPLAGQPAPALPELPGENERIDRIYKSIIRPPSGTYRSARAGSSGITPTPTPQPERERKVVKPEPPPPVATPPAPTPGPAATPRLPAADTLLRPKTKPARQPRARPVKRKPAADRRVAPGPKTAPKKQRAKPQVKPQARPKAKTPTVRPGKPEAERKPQNPAKTTQPVQPIQPAPIQRLESMPDLDPPRPRAKPTATSRPTESNPANRPDTPLKPLVRPVLPQIPRATASSRADETDRSQPAPPEAKGNPPGFAGSFTRQNRVDPADVAAERKQPEARAIPAGHRVSFAHLPGPSDSYLPVTRLPTDLSPTPRGPERYRSPDFFRGIYINNTVARNPARFAAFVRQAKANGLNTLVVDVQPRVPALSSIRAAREAGLYLVARTVVFEYGLKTYPPPLPHLEKVVHAAERAARSGFMEIQLDYIRFADRSKKLGVPLATRYRTIESFLKLFTDRLRPYGVRIGADVFGRIAFNRDDIIGQKLEVFAPHMDTIYPMLYPSHFYGDPKYQRDPYRAIYDGNRSSLRRVGDQSKIVAYIQGFDMKVNLSGLSYVNYIQRQIKAAEDSKSQGFIVWNAANRYAPFYRALRRHRKLP